MNQILITKLNNFIRQTWRYSLLVVLGIMVLTVWLWRFAPNAAVAAWWNDSWQFRQAIVVTNNTSAQTNVYISLTLNTLTASTSMQTDCGDFRFTTFGGEVLAYYIVSGCRSASNVIHVNFQTFPAGAQTIYFYYNNPSAPNGFSLTDFTTQASNYTIGTVSAAETGPGPIGYWSFDEGYGTTAHDATANKNDGIMDSGTSTMWQSEDKCVSGKCLYFDGYNDNVNAGQGNNSTFDFDTQITLSVWVKPLALEDGFIIRKALGGSEDKSLSWNSNGRFSFLSWNCFNEIYTNSIYPVNNWYHVVGVYDGNSVFIYVNGILDGSDVTSPDCDVSNSVSDLYIGSNQGLASFNGFLDEVKIYPYARTADQIRQDYAAGLAGMKTSHGVSAAFGSASDKWMSDGLVGYWPMDESATTSGAADLSGNGNTGTFYGNASTTAGKYGRGGGFDGTGDYIQGPDASSLNFGTGDFSVALWFKVSDIDDYRTFLNKGETEGSLTPDYWEFNMSSYGSLIFTTAENDVNTDTETSNEYEDDGLWHHAVALRRGTTVAIYVDGVEQSQAVGAIRNVSADTNRSLGIGMAYHTGYGGFARNPLLGKIDEVRIYNRALSPDEVRKLYEWAPGPIAHWKFDEFTGNTAYDSAASTTFSGGNHGTLGGGTAAYQPTWAYGKYGSALEYDGEDDFVDAGSSSNLDDLYTTGGLSVSAWIYPQNIEGSSRVIVNKDINYAGGWYFKLYYDSLEFSKYGTTDLWVRSNTPHITLNKWQHVAITWDGSVTATNVHLYINGKETGYDLQNNGANFGSDASLQCKIGNGSGITPFDGLIDDVRIYNYARTQKQILEDMQGGGPGVETRLIASLQMHFDEGKGTTAYDSSGYGNNGTLYPGTGGTNTATSAMWTMDGKFGKAIEFDGTDDYVSVGDVDIFDGSTQITAAAWVKSAGNIEETHIVDKSLCTGLSDQGVFELYKVYNSHKAQFAVYENGSSPINSGFSATDIDDGNWHYITGTYDTQRVRIYIDGVEENSVAASNITLSSTAYNVEIGGHCNGNDSFVSWWPGVIDEVKIYSYALTADEVKADYNSGKAAVMGSVGYVAPSSDGASSSNAALLEYCVPGSTDYCAAPVGEWKMDEFTGNTAYDTSGNGNDGTLGGGTAAYRPTWTWGKVGSALNFDGVDDYVNVNDPGTGSILDFNTGDSITISVWLLPKAYSQNSYPTFFLKGATESPVYCNYFFQSGSVNDNNQKKLIFGFRNFGNTDYIYTQTINDVLTLGTWQHLAATFTFGSGSSIKIYVNGVQKTTGSWSGASNGDDAPYVSNEPLWIGTDYNNEPFNGLIDQVRAYNYARTASQVAWEYNRGKPVAEWKFDECSGGTIHNGAPTASGAVGTLDGQLYLGTSGVTATGTCASSSDSFWYNGRTGKVNSAGSFDGTNDYVTMGDIDTLDNLSALTYAVWVKPTSPSELKEIFGKWSTSGNDGLALFTSNSSYQGADDILWGGWGGANFLNTNTNWFTNDTWHFIVGVFDGSQSGDFNRLKLYGDGVLQSAVYNGGIPATTPDNAYNFRVGADSEGGRNFLGLIDEVKIWNYALTAEQVKMEYAGGAVRFQ